VLPDIETDRSAHADGINQPLLPLTRSLPREGVLKLLCLVRMMKVKENPGTTCKRNLQNAQARLLYSFYSLQSKFILKWFVTKKCSKFAFNYCCMYVCERGFMIPLESISGTPMSAGTTAS
jgi:hypothetical protein